ncbi:MAG: hypothetical protein CFK52_00920 [Chloracidobacterium sp. CP2_5A]|nr:MAG: hypothetical protein CFK52_00920 [Chloracidobacterium sp. CP2_5A]
MAEGVTDVEELNKVFDRAAELCAFLAAAHRIEKVVAFIAERFRKNALDKSFVVAARCVDCAKCKKALDELLPPEWLRLLTRRTRRIR